MYILKWPFYLINIILSAVSMIEAAKRKINTLHIFFNKINSK